MPVAGASSSSSSEGIVLSGNKTTDQLTYTLMRTTINTSYQHALSTCHTLSIPLIQSYIASSHPFSSLIPSHTPSLPFNNPSHPFPHTLTLIPSLTPSPSPLLLPSLTPLLLPLLISLPSHTPSHPFNAPSIPSHTLSPLSSHTPSHPFPHTLTLTPLLSHLFSFLSRQTTTSRQREQCCLPR